MDCRTCEPILIDLVHDELATDAAEEARAHLSGCASCRASFERLVEARRLSAMLELAEPPQRVRAHLLQLAEARAGELRAAAAPKLTSPTFSRAVLDFVARFATGPQVGMATIMLLIVAFGLWALPRMRPDAVAGGTVINPESQGEAAPSKTGVEPAERLDLKVDARSGRIRNRDGQPEPPPPSAPTAASEAPAAAAVPAGPARGADDDPLGRLDDIDDIVGDSTRMGEKRKAVESKRAQDDGEALARAEGAAPEPSAAGEAKESAEPEPFPQSSLRTSSGGGAVGGLGKGAATVEEAEAAPPRPAVAQRAPAPSAAPQASPYRPATPASAERATAQSASGRRAAKPSPAALDELLDSAVSSSQPARHSTSLLAEARAVARAQGCAAALASYDKVVASAPTSGDAGSALIEMAQCRRAAGQLSEARRLLERAQEIPATAARARALLAELAARPAAR